ncbi:MAG: FAD-binding protein, partial [Methanobrevibacter sp.]|nr:FAD-binding protein [Methanobrevibacter sp.]
MEKYDIIIIGAGPGGLTAGIYAGRQGTETLILDKAFAGGVGREVPEMENYPGFDLISGLSLVEKMKAQCEKNVEIREFEGVNT